MTSGDGYPPDFVSLREYIESKIGALDRMVEQRIKCAEGAVGLAMTAAERAIVKAEAAIEKRLDGMNEFRGAYKDLLGGMMPRTESEQMHASTREKLDTVRELTSRLTLRSESEARWAAISHDISDINGRLTRIEGAGVGVKALWGVLVAVIGASAAVIGTILAVTR